MVQLYIKHTDNNFYLLDLEESESINFKLTVKDLNDISKIYSPFTQTFKIQSTDKNKILLGFYGNEKISNQNNNEFDSMLYISGFLFQSGIVTPDTISYEYQDQKTISVNFASNLSGLAEKLGDTTVQDLFKNNGLFDPLVKTVWNKNILKDRLSSIKNSVLSNGIAFKWGVPFISNNRVWVYDNNLAVIDNIAYNPITTIDSTNKIVLEEVRPSINYMAIMEHLLLAIGTPVICPLFERSEVKDLFVWCNAESLIAPDDSSFPLVGYVPAISESRYDVREDNNAVSLPSISNVKWKLTGDFINGIFKIKRNTITSGEQGGWSDGFDINLIFNDLVSLGNAGDTKIKVILKNATSNIVLDSQEITTNQYNFRIIDTVSLNPTMLNPSGEIFLKFEILPISLIDWSSISFRTIQKFNYTRRVGLANRTARATYAHTVINYTLSTSLGGNELNLISILPKIKSVDFLKSFFKTFNISVLSTGKQDGSMYWLTPSDIQETNKPYSKRIVDYTPFVDIATLSKKKANEYNQYSFKHFDSNYYESLRGDGSRFGNLIYPELPPKKPTKFEVQTSYSIIKQSNTFNHPSNVRTCLGFENENPEVLDNGANRYNPVYDEFTLFYLESKSLNYANLSVEYTPTNNAQLLSILEASFKNQNGKTLSFGAEGTIDTDSLYLNYYSGFIQMLLKKNTYLSEFILTLPPNEIFLNFSNLTQGESNIPTGFRGQNEIIISEQRYMLSDSTIDLTSGKTKLSLINF